MVRQAGQRMTDILGLKEKSLDSKQAIDSFVFDKEIYKDLYERSEPIQTSVAEGDEILRTYPDMAQDIFMSLYKHKPMPLEREDMADTHQFNHQMVQELMETDEFRKLRSKTRLDMIGSALGFEVLSNQAVETLRVYQEQMKQESLDKGGDGRTPFDDINDYIDGVPDSTGGAPGSEQGQGQQQGQGGAPNGQGGMSDEQAQELANQMKQNKPAPPPMTPQQKQDLMEQMKKDMQGAISQALDDVNETRDFLQAWGMEGGDPNNRITYEDKKAALQRLRKSDKLKRMSELIGHMKKLAINEQKQKAPDGAEAIKSVKTGNEIQSVLPSELAQLATKNGAIKKGFYRKYADKELLEYDKDVYESMGKGPMICCIDVSGSMHGEREKWSKAVALALLEVANKQKRNYAAIHYSSWVTGVWEIPYGQLKPDDVFDIAEKFAGGGTDFEEPLKKSMEIMNNSKFKKGDIVFITDGDCYVDDEFLEEFRALKKEKEFSVYTVLINTGGGGARRTVQEFSDKIINLSDLAKMGETSAREIFRGV